MTDYTTVATIESPKDAVIVKRKATDSIKLFFAEVTKELATFKNHKDWTLEIKHLGQVIFQANKTMGVEIEREPF